MHGSPGSAGSGLDGILRFRIQDRVGYWGIIRSSDWHTTDIEVSIRDSYDDLAVIGQQVVIRGIFVSFSINFWLMKLN